MSHAFQGPTILQVLPALDAGGVERGALEIADAITQAGGRALVASAGGRLAGRLHGIGARHIEFDLRGKSPWAIWRNTRKLVALIRAEGVDLVHARSRAPAWVASRACQRTRIPLVTTWHGLHRENWPGKKRYNAVLARGARVIAISDFIAQRLATQYGVGPDRLRLIPRGADIKAFDPARIVGKGVQSLAEAWAIPEGARVVMLPGRLTRWKGQALMLDALALLTTMLPGEWVCVFVGPADPDDRFVKELVMRARDLKISDRLRFAGLCQDMPAAYALADVVVAPSLRPEPFGRVAIEAQAMGRPVIVSAHGGAMETVLPEETGLLVAPGDAAALANAICAVLDAPPDALTLLAETARRHIVETYPTRRMQAATLGVYDELLGTSMKDCFLSKSEIVSE